MATKLEMMQAVAKDCNRVLKMDPAIPADLKTTEAMKKAILKEMDGELYDTDEANLKPETFAFLTNNLGVKPKEDPGQADAADPQDAIKEKPPREGGKPPTKSKAVQAKQEEEKAARKDAAEKGKETKEKKPGKTKGKDPDAPMTINEAKDAVRELLLAGKEMTRDQIAEKLDIAPKKAGDALSYLKNPKFSRGRPLNIKKDGEGRFHLPKKKKYLD